MLISARRVGPTGTAIGIDMTDEMLALARANAEAAGLDNVEFIKGYLEELPLPDASVDVVISNCVINLAADKTLRDHRRKAARVLRPGGRLAVSDVIADPDLDEETRADVAAWTGCIAGALTEAEFRAALPRPPASTRSRSGLPTPSTPTPPQRSSAHMKPALLSPRRLRPLRCRGRPSTRARFGWAANLMLGNHPVAVDAIPTPAPCRSTATGSGTRVVHGRGAQRSPRSTTSRGVGILSSP